MSGDLYKYIVDQTNRKTKEMMNSLFNLPKPTTQNEEVIIFTNSQLTRGRLVSTGVEVDTVVSGDPNPISDIGIKINDGLYLVYRHSPTVLIDSSSTDVGWIIIGAYPAGNADLPEFNLVNTSNWAKYRIPRESLSTIYDQTLDGIDGVWTCSLSPNRGYIVLTRCVLVYRNVITTNPYLGLIPPGTTGDPGDWSIDYYEPRIYYSVITGFSLDSINNLVDLTNATVTSNVTLHTYDGGTSDPNNLPPAAGVVWTEGGTFPTTIDPPVASLGDIVSGGITYTWLGWIVSPFSQYFVFPRTTVSYTSSGIPVIDVIGIWEFFQEGEAAWRRELAPLYHLTNQVPLGIGTTYSNVFSNQTDVGLWKLSDISGTLVHTVYTEHKAPDFPRPYINTNSYTNGFYGRNATLIKPDFSARDANFSSLVYRDSLGTANGLVDNGLEFSTGVPSPANKGTNEYYQTPYGNTTETFLTTIGDANYFAIDTVRKYGNYNSTTGWITDSASVKVTSTGSFLDLRTSSGALKFQRWTYNTSNATIGSGRIVNTTAIPAGFGVITQSSGTYTTYEILDYQVI